MEKPLITGVQGAAVGLGVAMLPLFDVVVASDASTFWTPYTRLGQGLEAGASFTFPHISRALVSELIYKGSVLSADEALHLGLITEVVQAKEFKEQLVRIAADIASQSDLVIIYWSLYSTPCRLGLCIVAAFRDGCFYLE